MSDNPSVTKEQLETIGRLMIEVLQGAADAGLEELTIGDLMRTFGFSDEESEPWDDAILVFIKNGYEQGSTSYVIH